MTQDPWIFCSPKKRQPAKGPELMLRGTCCSNFSTNASCWDGHSFSIHRFVIRCGKKSCGNPEDHSDFWWFLDSLLMFIDVYWCLLMFIDVYWCLLMFIDVYCWLHRFFSPFVWIKHDKTIVQLLKKRTAPVQIAAVKGSQTTPRSREIWICGPALSV